MSVADPNPQSRPDSQPHPDSQHQPQPWRPRLIRLGEAELELRWWGPVQLALTALLAVVAVVAVVMMVLQLAGGDMPWQAAAVVSVVPLAAAITAGWLFHHREVGLRLDSRALTHHNRLGGFAVPWDQVRGVELVSGRGGPILRVLTTEPVDRAGRRGHDIMVDNSQVPAIAEAVQHWTGRPLQVRAAGTTVPWRQDDELET